MALSLPLTYKFFNIFKRLSNMAQIILSLSDTYFELLNWGLDNYSPTHRPIQTATIFVSMVLLKHSQTHSFMYC